MLYAAAKLKYRPDLLHFSFLGKEKFRFGSVKPSPATVHRTVVLDCSNLAVLNYSKRKKDIHSDVLFGGTGQI